MTPKDIPFKAAGNNVLKPGAIILYKTNENNYGKLKIGSIGDASSPYSLTIDVITYNKADGTPLIEKKR